MPIFDGRSANLCPISEFLCTHLSGLAASQSIAGLFKNLTELYEVSCKTLRAPVSNDRPFADGFCGLFQSRKCRPRVPARQQTRS
jgi:hypothetical protein